ncbi:PhpK family radical SAM P-methyltransferase [Paenibacillus sp. MER 180]|uniref:PhpK family radical SAM P-methyltransferase n=1 Tax=Paenibacillus sp. MER 180 TaxID=2939570 RepID=UPI00203A7BDA|nr:PhpK family radical SAM P-methyltransferase [Paenibacillus sp. MER 180]MCM3291597.1 PhpK family radical SAM P-methyltransferase [Paenibacillus sp. MER 180]
MERDQLDYILIGYNEPSFSSYEQMLSNYGKDSEAYRDLKFSFVEVDGQKLNYIDLMNYVYKQAFPNSAQKRDMFVSGEIPNLAAVYLSNHLYNKGVKGRYVNLFQYEKDKLIQYLSMNPLVIGITTTFYVLNFPVIEMVNFIREHNQNVKIVVGGPLILNHFRNYDKEGFEIALEDIGADIYVVESQGELTLTKVIGCLKEKGNLSSVPNLAFFENGDLITTHVEPESNNLDENYINWMNFQEESLGHTIQTRTARSCAFNCAFCNYPTRAGKLTLTDITTVELELDSIKKLGNVSNVVFIDDTFNVPIERFKEICRLMIRKQYNFNWFSYFRCANADEEAIELMAESGCKGVFLGIESGAPSILKNMNKAATIEKYSQGIKTLKKHGILTFGSFIAGFPGESEETLLETTNFIKETKMDYFRAQLWYCEKGTKIDAQREKYDISGEGFVWRHATLNSGQAMDYLERLQQEIEDSQWLPQWSFDFWIIPYLLGKGVTLEQFKAFMIGANSLMSLNFVDLNKEVRIEIERKQMSTLIKEMAAWKVI